MVTYFKLDFFFTNNTRLKYDVKKILLFNILYCGGKEEDKASLLYDLIENKQQGAVINNSKVLLRALEILIYIPCIIIGQLVNSTKHFPSDIEE